MPSYMASYEDLNQSSRHDVLDYDPNAVFDESAAADSFALTSIAESEDDHDDDSDSGRSSRSSRSSSSRSSSRSSRSSRSRSRRRPRFTERRRISLESTVTGIDDDDDVEPTPSELTATSNNGAGNNNNLYPQLHELQPGGFHPTRQDDDKQSTRHQQQQQQQDEEQYQNDAPRRRRRSPSPFSKRNQKISSLYPQLHELELSSGGYNPRDKHNNEWEQQQQGDDSTTVSIKTDDAPHDDEQGYRENIESRYDDVHIAREGTSSTINTTPASSSSSHDSRQKQRTNNGGGNTKHNSNTKAKAKKRVMKRRLVKIQLCDPGGSNNKNEMSTVVTVAMNVAQHLQQDGILLGGRNDSSLGVGQRIQLEQLHQHDSNGYSKSSNWGKDEQRTVDISWQQTPSSHFGATGAFNNKNNNQGEEEEQVWKPPLDLSQGEVQQQQQQGQPSPANSNTNTGSSSRWKPSFDASSKQQETNKGIKHTERGIIQQGRRVGVDIHRDYYGGDQHGRGSSRDEEERVNQPQQSTSLEPSGSRLSQMNSSAEPPTPNPLKVSIQQQQQQSKLSTSSMEKSPRSVKHEEEDLAWEEKKDDHNNNVLPPTQQQQQQQPTSTTLLSTSTQPTPSSVKGLEPFTIPSILTTTVLKSTPTEKVGLAFRKANGTIVIEKIVPGSAFDGTALRPGFECLCINGHRLRSARRAAEIVRESGYSLTLMASNAPRPPGTMYTMISLDTIVSSSRDTTQDAVSVSSVGGGYACGMYFKMKHGLVQLVKVDPTNSPISSTSIKLGDFVLAMNGQVIGGIGKAVEVLSEVSTKSNDHDNASASSSGGNNVPILYFNMRQLRVSLVDKVIGDLWKKEWNEKYDECVVLQPSSSSEQSGGSAANGQPLTLRFKEEGMCELLDPLRGFRNEKGGDSGGVPSNHPLNSVVETLNHGIICVLSAIREGVELATTAAGSPSSSSSHGNNSKKSNESSGGIVAELSKLSASPVK